MGVLPMVCKTVVNIIYSLALYTLAFAALKKAGSGSVTGIYFLRIFLK